MGHRKNSKMPKEACIKISIATTGSNNPFYGKKHTEETKQGIREKQTGKKQSIETVQKRVEKNTGQKRTPEQRQRMKEARQRYLDSIRNI